MPRNPGHRNTVTSQQTGKRNFRHPFGQRHYGRNGHGGRTAEKDVDPELVAARNRFRMMSTDAAMNLIMESRLPVRLKPVAGKLDPVHPQIRFGQTWVRRTLAVHLRQRQERTAIIRP